MAASTSSNSTLTQDQVERILIQPLKQRSSYLSQGFPVFSSNGEPIRVPSLSSYGTAGYVAQGSAIPEVNPSTSEVVLLSSDVKAAKVISRVSNELVRQSVVNVETAFGAAITAEVSRLLDSAMWNGGTATAGSPIGMANFSGNTNAGTAAGTAITSSTLYDIDQIALDSYLESPYLKWAMSPKNWTYVRKLTDNYGARVLQPALAEGAPSTLLGHPVTVTKHVPDTKILLYDTSQVAVGMDQQASITILDQTYADTDEIGIRVTARYDTKPLNAAGVIAFNVT